MTRHHPPTIPDAVVRFILTAQGRTACIARVTGVSITMVNRIRGRRERRALRMWAQMQQEGTPTPSPHQVAYDLER